MSAHEDHLKTRMISGLDGNSAAYAELLRALVPLLHTYFRRRLSSGDDIGEDLVQETLIAVHTRRNTFDRDRPFTAWLFAIARHKLVDHFRRNRHQHYAYELVEDLMGESFEAYSSAQIDIERLLGTLPAKQSSAIRATRIDGHSLVEAAEAAGISASDAKISVYRGLKRLTAQVQRKS